jgi:hypothetical protein
MHTEVLLRTMARNQGRGLVDLNWQSEMVLHGASNYHRELIEVPEVLGWALTPTAPFVMNTDSYSWSAMIKLTVPSSTVWAAIGTLRIQLSPMPGNEFIIDKNPTTNFVRYEGRLWGREVATTVSTSGSTLTTTVNTPTSGGLTWTGGQNLITFDAGGLTGKEGQCILLPGVDISGQNQRTYINQVIDDTHAAVDDFWWGNGPGGTQTTFSDTVAVSIGGQMFIADDARAQVDVVITWGGTNVYRGQITGFTDANTVTLTPAPPSLTGQAAVMWLGRVSVPATVTTMASTGLTASLFISFNRDVLSVRSAGSTKIFRGVVERWGGRIYPKFSCTTAGTVSVDFTNLYADRDCYFMPSGTVWDIWGTGDFGYAAGGGGGHDTSTLAERLTRPAYEALDLCTT